MTKQPDTPKQPYEPPKLIEYGSFQKLTKANFDHMPWPKHESPHETAS